VGDTGGGNVANVVLKQMGLENRLFKENVFLVSMFLKRI